MASLANFTFSPYAKEFQPAAECVEPVKIAAPPGLCLDLDDVEDTPRAKEEGPPGLFPPPGLSAPPGLDDVSPRVLALEEESKRLQEENMLLMNKRLELESQRLASENEFLRATLAKQASGPPGMWASAAPPGVLSAAPPGVFTPQGPPGMWMPSWTSDAWSAEKALSDDDDASTAAASVDDSPVSDSPSSSEGESVRRPSFNVSDAA